MAAIPFFSAAWIACAFVLPLEVLVMSHFCVLRGARAAGADAVTDRRLSDQEVPVELIIREFGKPVDIVMPRRRPPPCYPDTRTPILW